MLYVDLFCSTQSIPARISLVRAVDEANTSRAAIRVPGAIPRTIPATLVPWPLASSAPSSGAISRAATTLQPAGTPGDVQLPNAARV